MENLGLDIKLISAQIISFVVFFTIFKKFVSKPLLKFLNKQKEDEELRASLAIDLEKRKATLEAKDRKIDKERKVAFEAAILEGKKEANRVKKDLIDNAKIQADSIIKRGQEQLKEEKEILYKDIRKQIAQVSIMVVNNALSDYLTPDAQKQVTKKITEKIPEVKI